MKDLEMNILNDPLNEVFSAYVKDEIVVTMVIQTRGAFSGYLKSIAVKSTWRGKRLGEQIGVLKDYLVKGHDEILMRKTIAPILQSPNT